MWSPRERLAAIFAALLFLPSLPSCSDEERPDRNVARARYLRNKLRELGSHPR